MNSDEKMFVAQGIYKAISAEVKTNTPGNMRGEFDERYRQRYRETGAKSYDALIGGNKVGSVSVKPDEPKPKTAFEVVDFDSLEEWYPDAEDGFSMFVVANLPEFAEFWFQRTGEMPPGCELVTETPEPKEPTVRLTIDPQKVAQAVDGLPWNEVLKLEGGE